MIEESEAGVADIGRKKKKKKKRGWEKSRVERMDLKQPRRRAVSVWICVREIGAEEDVKAPPFHPTAAFLSFTSCPSSPGKLREWPDGGGGSPQPGASLILGCLE